MAVPHGKVVNHPTNLDFWMLKMARPVTTIVCVMREKRDRAVFKKIEEVF